LPLPRTPWLTQRGRYFLIEKQALALVWACEKFTDYISGIWFLLETDHKPLVPLLAWLDEPRLFATTHPSIPYSSHVFPICHFSCPWQAVIHGRHTSYPVHQPLQQQPATSRKKCDRINRPNYHYLPANTDQLNKYVHAHYEDNICSQLIHRVFITNCCCFQLWAVTVFNIINYTEYL
jgi:hypothetical protein